MGESGSRVAIVALRPLDSVEGREAGGVVELEELAGGAAAIVLESVVLESGVLESLVLGSVVLEVVEVGAELPPSVRVAVAAASSEGRLTVRVGVSASAALIKSLRTQPETPEFSSTLYQV
jgi:hypothetical protein